MTERGSSRNVLSIPIPTSPNLSSSLTSALRTSILSHAGESHHPDTFASDISSLVDLRSQAATLEPHQSSLTAAYTYHAQLVFVSTKLPATSFPLALPWSQPMLNTSLLSFAGATAAKAFVDAGSSEATSGKMWNQSEAFALVYDNVAYVAHPSLVWERCNVLFALAALLSEMGGNEARSDGASIKRAVGYFQSSSAILTHLETNVLPGLSRNPLSPTTPSHNLTPASIRPLATLTLAQAQECFWQKAASDGMKSGTIAKLARAVEDLYAQTSQEAQRAHEETGLEALSRTWVNHINTKRYHFAAATQFRKSQEDLSNSRYGDEIARLQLADSHVKSALAALKRGLPSTTSTQSVANDLGGLQSVIESNLKRARKDNDLIYLEPITAQADLATITGARMVQAKLPVQVAQPIDCLRARGEAASANAALPTLGKPLFGALVPYGAHVAISVYEDRKETWWREAMEGRRQELEAVVKSTLDSLNLPGAVDALDRGDAAQQQQIPPTLLSFADTLRDDGGVDVLQQLRSEVERVSAHNNATLDEAREALEVEAQEDAAVRSRHREYLAARPESHIAAQGYWHRFEELSATVKMAEQSDAVVRGKMERWDHAWRVLAGGKAGIERELPREENQGDDVNNTASSSSLLSSSSPVVRDLRTTLETIDDCLAEFAALSSETRAVVRNDDVREKVMREVARISASVNGGGEWYGVQDSDDDGSGGSIGADSFEELFQVEFGKYRAVEGQVGKFEARVASLLDQLRNQQSTLSQLQSRQTHYNSQLNATLTSLSTAAKKYTEVQSNLREGLQFYRSLAPMIDEFRQQVREYKSSREIDVQQLVGRLGAVELQDAGGEGEEEGRQDVARQDVAAQKSTRGADVDGESGSTDAALNTPRRSTRAKTRQTNASPQQQQQPAQQQPPPPQWGAWSGGAIQFDD